MVWLMGHTLLQADDGATKRNVGQPPSIQKHAAAPRTVSEWLVRMDQASQRRAYVGTYVVAAGGSLSGAKLWHVCDGTQQMERIESMTGAPKTTLRHNDHVMTFLPATKVVRSETRVSLGAFPAIVAGAVTSVDRHYSAIRLGEERVANVDAEVLLIQPRDAWRYGYRIWAESQTGLVVKMQTLDGKGGVLEQMAFTELQLDAPVKMERLAQMMANTEGYRIERLEVVATSAQAEGWEMRRAVDGFVPSSCVRRPAAQFDGKNKPETLQWIFSDGLASVSMFLEPYDRRRHRAEESFSAGATHTLTRRVDDWWLTAVGEVPQQTLKAFAEALVRTR